MRVIHKYHLLWNTDHQTIMVRGGAKPLKVAMQNGVGLVMWCEVDADQRLVPRNVRIVGTGHEFDASILDYVGTVEPVTGLILHVYFE